MNQLSFDIFSSKDLQHLAFKADANDIMALYEEYRRLKQHIISYTANGMRFINTSSCRQSLREIEAKYKDVVGGKISAVFSAFSHAPEDSVVHLFLAVDSSYVERRATAELIRRGYDFKDSSWKHLYNRVFETLSLVRMQFDLISFGWNGEKISVGEIEKTKRVCRFCGKSMPKVAFKNEAHAIPESLGNKLLKCREECDNCNNTLNWIEDSYRSVMDFSRAMYGISRKGTLAAPEVVGQNYLIKPDNKTGEAQLYVMADEIPSGTDIHQPFLMKMNHKFIITNQNVYRALCKMVIDLLPSNLLSEFEQTIIWIVKQYSTPDSLPSHYSRPLSNGLVYNQPVIDIFINRDHRATYSPFCTAVLYVCDMAYLWIMPLVGSDNGMFKYDEDLEYHLKLMTEITGGRRWYPHDSYDCRESYAHKFWTVDVSKPNVFIRPKTDAVFTKCLAQKKFPEGTVLPVYDPNDVVLTNVRTEFTNRFESGTVSLADARDVDITRYAFHSLPLLHGKPIVLIRSPREKTIPPPSHVIIVSGNGRKLKFWTKFTASKVNKGLTYFDTEIEVEFISKSPNVEFNDSFAVFDYVMHEDIKRRAYSAAEKVLRLKRAGTPFETWSVRELENEVNSLEHSGYIVIDSEPYRYYTFNSLHFRGPGVTERLNTI